MVGDRFRQALGTRVRDVADVDVAKGGVRGTHAAESLEGASIRSAEADVCPMGRPVPCADQAAVGVRAPANPVTDGVSGENRRAVWRGSIMCIIGDLLSTSDASSDTSAILSEASSELSEMPGIRACRA